MVKEGDTEDKAEAQHFRTQEEKNQLGIGWITHPESNFYIIVYYDNICDELCFRLREN